MISDLYVENNVGGAVRDVINAFTPRHGVTAHHQHHIHPGMQRAQNGDEWWIRDVSARGMAILCQDSAILEVKDERDALVESEGVLIALGDAQYTTWDKARCLFRHWDEIETVLKAGGPAAIKLYLSRVEVIDLSA